MGGGGTVAAHWRYTCIRYWDEEAAGVFPCFSTVAVSGQTLMPAPGEVPCTTALGGAVAPCWQLVMFLVILCRKGVLGVLWLFSLDHLSAAVFNELEKK